MCVITAKKSSTTGLCQYARRSVAQNFKLVRRKGVEKRKVERRRRARWKAVRGEKKQSSTELVKDEAGKGVVRKSQSVMVGFL